MSFLSISTCELIRVNLCSDSIDSNGKVMICYGSISCFNTPQWFRKSINCCWWIKDYFCSVQAKGHPMQRMMTSIADIDSNFSKLCFKDWMSCLSLHVITRFIEISDSWNVSFLLFPKNISMIINNNGSIMKSFFILFSFENGRYDDHIVLFS